MSSFSLLLLLILTVTFTVPVTVTGISTPSLDALLFLLRSNGHSLLANSIATSDLVFDVLSLQTLTILAPPDPSLFALDMTQPPPAYLSTLRLHVIPASIDLNPSSHSFVASSRRLIPTLLPSRALRPSFSGEGNLLLDGVPVLLPRVYHSREFSVYRLRGPLPSSPTVRNDTVLLHPALSPPFRNGNPPSYSAPIGAATDPPTPAASPSHPPNSKEKMHVAPIAPPTGSFPELLYSLVHQSSPLSAREAGKVPSPAPAQDTPVAPSFAPAGSFLEFLYSPPVDHWSPLSSAQEAGKVPSLAPASRYDVPPAPSVTPAGSLPEFLYSPVAPTAGNWRVGFKAEGEECGPLCSSDASAHVNSRNDVVESTEGQVVDDYSIRRFADYGL